jgi:hypothetical protein
MRWKLKDQIRPMAKVENSTVVIKGLIEENNENLYQIEKRY